MWIGTRNGLNRYDGHSFKIFRPATGNSISGEVINDIAEDSRGRIWVATMEGLNIYDPATGRWELMQPDDANPQNSLPNYIIWDIFIDEDDIVWIVPDNSALVSYNIRSSKFTRYDWKAFAASHPQTNKSKYRSIQRLVRKNEHEFWLGTNNGLATVDITTRTFQFNGGSFNGDVIDLQYDAARKLVFLSAERGFLFRYDEANNSYSEIIPSVLPYPSERFTPPGKNEIWMASQKGLIRIDDAGGTAVLEVNIPQLTGSLLPGGVNDVYSDNRKQRWVATANGISIYDPGNARGSFLPLLAISDKEGLNRMGGVYYDDSSNCYFACALDPAGVFIISTITGEIQKITTDAAGNKLSFCTAVKKDRNNNLWLLTGNSVYQYNRAAGLFIHFPTPNNNDEIVFRDMLHDQQGNYWFSSSNRHPYYYLTKEKRFAVPADSTVHDLTTSSGLQEDEKNQVIVAGTFGQGAFIYDLNKGVMKSYYERNGAKQYGQLSLVNSATRDSYGGIWLSTFAGGVYRYNPGQDYDNTFTRFGMRDGLRSNNVLSMCSNRDSVLWMLTTNGLSAMSTSGRFLYDLDEKNSFSFSSYGSDNRYPHEIYFNTRHDELLAGIGGGLFLYSEGRYDSALHFPIVITGVRINNRLLTEEEMNSATGYRLPYSSNAVMFEFAGLYYGNEPGISYEYKLEGYDTGWQPAGNNYSAAYQNLPSGNYLFKVRARRETGGIAGEASFRSFSVVQPFWKRWWFILLALAGTAFITWRFIRNLQQKLRLEQMVNEFATSLYGQNTTEDIFWDTARNCIQKLGFTDCVVYQRNDHRNVLQQVAAFGPKNPSRREITNLIEIPVGSGIVGAVAQTGKAIRIADTSRDPRYIVDDERRFSEIAVPVIVDGKVFAVIDSEHPEKRFYTLQHMRALKKIAAICGERISKHLTEERLRAKIARDLHDEMGSTLTSINIISKVAMEGKQDAGKTTEYFSKIKDHSGRMMESMSDMVWAINPVNDSFEKVLLHMKEFAAEILEPARINYQFSEENIPENTFLNPEQRKNIYLVFKEAINNVAKYSGAEEVSVFLNMNNNILQMIIADNGKGFDTTASGTGNGLRNMHTRAEEMGASISITSTPGKGTTIGLYLPVT